MSGGKNFEMVFREIMGNDLLSDKGKMVEFNKLLTEMGEPVYRQPIYPPRTPGPDTTTPGEGRRVVHSGE